MQVVVWICVSRPSSIILGLLAGRCGKKLKQGCVTSKDKVKEQAPSTRSLEMVSAEVKGTDTDDDEAGETSPNAVCSSTRSMSTTVDGTPDDGNVGAETGESKGVESDMMCSSTRSISTTVDGTPDDGNVGAETGESKGVESDMMLSFRRASADLDDDSVGEEAHVAVDCAVSDGGRTDSVVQRMSVKPSIQRRSLRYGSSESKKKMGGKKKMFEVEPSNVVHERTSSTSRPTAATSIGASIDALHDIL